MVIEQYQFKILEGLSEDAVDPLSKETGMIIVGDDDANLRVPSVRQEFPSESSLRKLRSQVQSVATHQVAGFNDTTPPAG
jgi:hypothetical protein